MKSSIISALILLSSLEIGSSVYNKYIPSNYHVCKTQQSKNIMIIPFDQYNTVKAANPDFEKTSICTAITATNQDMSFINLVLKLDNLSNVAF